MLSETFLCLHTRLDALDSAPLATRSPFSHHITEHLFLNNLSEGAHEVLIVANLILFHIDLARLLKNCLVV